jgi:hypothetical protein
MSREKNPPVSKKWLKIACWCTLIVCILYGFYARYVIVYYSNSILAVPVIPVGFYVAFNAFTVFREALPKIFDKNYPPQRTLTFSNPKPE